MPLPRNTCNCCEQHFKNYKRNQLIERLKLKNISGSIIDYISGAKSEGVDFGDVNELILSYWDESVDFNDENIMLVKEFIGDVDKIKAYW